MLPDGRPHVLVIAWDFPVASETFVVRQVVALLDRGWAVTLCCVRLDDAQLAEHDGLADRLEQIVVLGPDVAAPTLTARVAGLVREGQARHLRSRVSRHAALLAGPLRRVIREVEPDLVDAHYGPNAAAAALAADHGHPPVIADIHGYDVTEIPKREGWAAYRRLLGDMPLVVNAEFSADLVAAGMGRDAVLLRRPPPADFTAAVRPAEWTVPLRLLCAGRLVPQKGVDVAIDALTQLVDRRPSLDPRLTVLGDGPERSELEDRARRADVGDRVVFLGNRPHDEVATAMAEHAIVLVPSRPTSDGWVEAFGNVAAEGIATGAAVIASDIGGLPEATAGRGVLVEPNDPRAVADAILRLVDGTTPADVAAAARTSQGMTADDGWDAFDALARCLLRP